MARRRILKRVVDDPDLVALIDAEIDGWAAGVVDSFFNGSEPGFAGSLGDLRIIRIIDCMKAIPGLDAALPGRVPRAK